MTYRLGLLARWALALGVASAVLSGCKSEAHPQSAPPPEVSIIEVRPGPVTVFDEYVAQTQAPDTIECVSGRRVARDPNDGSGWFDGSGPEAPGVGPLAEGRCPWLGSHMCVVAGRLQGVYEHRYSAWMSSRADAPSVPQASRYW